MLKWKQKKKKYKEKWTTFKWYDRTWRTLSTLNCFNACDCSHKRRRNGNENDFNMPQIKLKINKYRPRNVRIRHDQSKLATWISMWYVLDPFCHTIQSISETSGNKNRNENYAMISNHWQVPFLFLPFWRIDAAKRKKEKQSDCAMLTV